MSERCASCTAEEADRDGDGEASMACGGLDCDDADPLRYSAAIEVCDVFHVDEDCDLGTLYNADAAGAPGDRDGDGHVDAACGNIVGDSEAFGDDCDDRDASVNPSAPERCNGVDDDCDGAVDEDFECVQSTDVAGTNACGREAFRRCDDTCAFVEDGFYVAESAATCDYCEDSGTSLDAELPFTVDYGLELCTAPISGPNTVRGDILETGRCEHDFSGSARLTDGAATSQAGALMVSPLRLGYGPIVVDIDLVVHEAGSPNDSSGGVAFVVARSATPLTHGPASRQGIPTGLSGFAVQWLFGGYGGSAPPEEHMALVRLDAAGDSELGRSSMGPPPSRSTGDPWRVDIRPDDPTTPDDETRVRAWAGCIDSVCRELCSGRFRIECSNSEPAGSDICYRRTACGTTLSPGEDVVLGLTAGFPTGQWSVYAETSPVTIDAACPGG